MAAWNLDAMSAATAMKPAPISASIGDSPPMRTDFMLPTKPSPVAAPAVAPSASMPAISGVSAAPRLLSAAAQRLVKVAPAASPAAALSVSAAGSSPANALFSPARTLVNRLTKLAPASSPSTPAAAVSPASSTLNSAPAEATEANLWAKVSPDVSPAVAAAASSCASSMLNSDELEATEENFSAKLAPDVSPAAAASESICASSGLNKAEPAATDENVSPKLAPAESPAAAPAASACSARLAGSASSGTVITAPESAAAASTLSSTQAASASTGRTIVASDSAAAASTLACSPAVSASTGMVTTYLISSSWLTSCSSNVAASGSTDTNALAISNPEPPPGTSVIGLHRAVRDPASAELRVHLRQRRRSCHRGIPGHAGVVRLRRVPLVRPPCLLPAARIPGLLGGGRRERTGIGGETEDEREEHGRLHARRVIDPVKDRQIRGDIGQVIGHPADLREPFLCLSFGASTAPAMILLAASTTAFRSSSVRSSKAISASQPSTPRSVSSMKAMAISLPLVRARWMYRKPALTFGRVRIEYMVPLMLNASMRSSTAGLTADRRLTTFGPSPEPVSCEDTSMPTSRSS